LAEYSSIGYLKVRQLIECTAAPLDTGLRQAALEPLGILDARLEAQRTLETGNAGRPARPALPLRFFNRCNAMLCAVGAGRCGSELARPMQN